MSNFIELNEIYQLIDDDSLAASFQSLAQYRAYLRERVYMMIETELAREVSEQVKNEVK